jgi:hypothetical protein
MSKIPTVPDLPEDDTVLSPTGWQAMLWLRLGSLDRKLSLVCLLLSIILVVLLSLFFFPTSH